MIIRLDCGVGEISVVGLNQQMIMVGHEAVGVANPIVALINVLESLQKVLAVLVILKDRLLLIPAGSYMIDCAGILYAERTGHNATIAHDRAICNEKDLTLIWF